MPIGSIVIKQNPVVGDVDFSDILIAGSPSAWVLNSYEHEIRALGGFWKASFSIQPNMLGVDYLEGYLENGLGRNIDVFSPTGDLVWQGYINRLKLELPGADVEVSLENMGNEVWVRYTATLGGAITRSAEQDDLDSQAKFGIKEQVLSGGVISVAAAADQAAAAYLTEYADPRRSRISIKSATSGRNARLRVSCRGYWHTLNWRTYNQTVVSTDQDADAQIQDIIDDMGQFIANTDLVSNTTQVTEYYDSDDLAGDAIVSISKLADSNNDRHIVGVYEDRILTYEKVIDIDADRDLIKYGFQVKSNVQLITELGTGNIILPSQVRPNNWLKVMDLFGSKIPKSVNPSQSPRNAFVESVVYKEPFGISIPGYEASQIESILNRINSFGGNTDI